MTLDNTVDKQHHKTSVRGSTLEHDCPTIHTITHIFNTTHVEVRLTMVNVTIVKYVKSAFIRSWRMPLSLYIGNQEVEKHMQIGWLIIKYLNTGTIINYFYKTQKTYQVKQERMERDLLTVLSHWRSIPKMKFNHCPKPLHFTTRFTFHQCWPTLSEYFIQRV